MLKSTTTVDLRTLLQKDKWCTRLIVASQASGQFLSCLHFAQLPLSLGFQIPLPSYIMQLLALRYYVSSHRGGTQCSLYIAYKYMVSINFVQTYPYKHADVVHTNTGDTVL